MTNMKEHLPEFFPESLSGECSRVVLTRHERLFRVGTPAVHTHFVLAGEITAVRYLADGNEAVMQRAREGEFFAQSAMLVRYYSCDAVAAAPSEVVRIPVEALRAALTRGGDFALAFAGQLAGDLRRQCTRVERLRLRSARDRVLHYLACEGPLQGGDARLKNWAAELGLAPETLSRTLADMGATGEIVREARRVVQSTGPMTPGPCPG